MAFIKKRILTKWQEQELIVPSPESYQPAHTDELPKISPPPKKEEAPSSIHQTIVYLPPPSPIHQTIEIQDSDHEEPFVNLCSPPKNGREQRLTKDEKKARNMFIDMHITVKEIIHLPMDELSSKLANSSLSEEQKKECYEIRKRGKNKVAAQNCKIRKNNEIRNRKNKKAELSKHLEKKRIQNAKITKELEYWKEKLCLLERDIIKQQELDPEDFTIMLDKEGITFGKRNSKETLDDPSKEYRLPEDTLSKATNSIQSREFNHPSHNVSPKANLRNFRREKIIVSKQNVSTCKEENSEEKKIRETKAKTTDKTVGKKRKRNKEPEHAEPVQVPKNRRSSKGFKNKPKDKEHPKKANDTLDQIRKATSAVQEEKERCWICQENFNGTALEIKCPRCDHLGHFECLRGDGCPNCRDERDIHCDGLPF